MNNIPSPGMSENDSSPVENNENNVVNNNNTSNKFVELINKFGKFLGIAISIVVFLLLIIKIFVKDPQYYKDNKKAIQISQSKIDSIYKKQDSLSLKLEDLEKGQIMFYDIISQSNVNQQKIESEINNLKKYFNEKINSVNNYSISDLDSFFRTKYSRYYQKEN